MDFDYPGKSEAGRSWHALIMPRKIERRRILADQLFDKYERILSSRRAKIVHGLFLSNFGLFVYFLA